MAYEALYTRARPKNFSQLIGQEHISNALARAVSGGKTSHAYLLVGTRGTGKTSTARLLAKAMNCEKVLEAQQSGEILSPKVIPCNKCSSCLTISSSPDNVEFDAASNRSVEDVTRLLSTAYLAPLQSRVKTFIIDEVHMLSFEAVNSILKLIEEPPPNVAFFLATTELHKVPMTIRSRCQVLNFRLIPQERITPYLLVLAKRLQVELEEDAAKKIARLAAGSMRDAMTYLDQCYATADEKITLDSVNETLGLISDSDLDKIISAIKSQERAAVAEATAHAFRSGLSAVSIAESLIVRLRDWEFKNLTGNDAELKMTEIFIDEIRKAIFEMNGSGVPDIILEMTLLKLAAPVRVKSSSAQAAEAPPQKNPAQAANINAFIDKKPPEIPAANKNYTRLTGNLDEDKKIFYDLLERLRDDELTNLLKRAEIVNFSEKSLILKFAGGIMRDTFIDKHKQKLEEILEENFGKPIKIQVVGYENPKREDVFAGLDENAAAHLKKAMNIFKATKFDKIKM